MGTTERSFLIKFFQLDATRFSSWKVAYTVFKSPMFGHEDWWVYMGIRTPQHLCSSINMADEIIAGIIKEEGLDCASVRFFDLQTFSYYKKNPGEFEFDEVRGYDPAVKHQSLVWSPTRCPSGVQEVFGKFIGTGSSGTTRQQAIDKLEALRAKAKL